MYMLESHDLAVVASLLVRELWQACSQRYPEEIFAGNALVEDVVELDVDEARSWQKLVINRGLRQNRQGTFEGLVGSHVILTIYIL